MTLHQIQHGIQLRTAEISAAHSDWPCRKGCDECCRSLASAPHITEAEWRPIAIALDALPAETATQLRERIRASAAAQRPVVCPLLDLDSGACLIYDVRPIACRAYGFYAEREAVLGCHRIEEISRQSPDIVWGNHLAVEKRMQPYGPAAELSVWLDS